MLVNECDNRTALDKVCFRHADNSALLGLMRLHGAKCGSGDAAGESLYSLLEEGNNANLAWLLAEHSGDERAVNWQDHENDFAPGYSLLLRAVKNKNVEAVRLLVATPGVDVNHKLSSGYGCDAGQLALSLALSSGHREIADILRAAGGKERTNRRNEREGMVQEEDLRYYMEHDY